MVLVRYVISILREAALLVGCIVKVTGRWVGARNAQASNIAKRRRDACIYIQFYQFKCVYSTHNLYIITCHPFLRGKSVLICQNYYKKARKFTLSITCSVLNSQAAESHQTYKQHSSLGK